MGYTTIKDIAEKLGISSSTVSRALRGDERIKKDTRELIIQTAELLKYSPNYTAVGLRRKRSFIVGMIIPEMVTSFFVTIINQVQNELKKNGYRLIIAQSQENVDIERSNLEMMEQYRVDAILMSVCHKSKNIDVYDRFINRGTPIIFFDRVPDIGTASKVIIDDYKKAFFLVEHLIRKGHRRILHLAGPAHIQNAVDRKRAYTDALQKFKITYDPALYVTAGISIEDGEETTRKIKEIYKTEFDAIFCFTDTLAIGAKNYLQKHGYKIPTDVALAGFSGSLLSTIIQPQLTTVEQPLDQMADAVCELLFKHLDDKDRNPETIVLDAEIKLRESTEGKQ